MVSKGSKRLVVGGAVVALIVGVYLAARPLVADLFWAHASAEAVEELAGCYEGADEDGIRALKDEARAYNAALAEKGAGAHELTEEEETLYLSQMGGAATSQTMGALEIPSLGIVARVLFGTSDTTLMAGVGHCEWSSLPVGGPSTHCVLSGHSGMEDYRMFDNLADLATGDHVYLTSLGETLVYEVESTETALPQETDSLAIERGRDLLTLVTCTPYGVNSHRLLVHCTRCDHPPQTASQGGSSSLVFASVTTIPWIRLVPVVLVVLIVVALIVSLWRNRTQKERRLADERTDVDALRGADSRARRRRKRNYSRRRGRHIR